MRFFRKSWKYQVTTVIKYLFLILVAIVSLYPFIWVLISSFKDNNSIFGDPFGLPVKIAFENYKEVWAGADVGRNFFNSMIVCLTTLVILIIITSMGCYILTRVWKNTFLSTYFSLGIMIPIHALLIPSVLIFKKIGLTDNLFSLVLMYTAINISLSMYIMNGFFDSIPREMDEAATIDGCSRSQIFLRIIFPIAKPGIATVATLAFLNCWNDLLMGLVLISSPQKKTLSLASCFIDGIYNKLNSGFTFLKLYYQIEVVAGISNLVQGAEALNRSYALAVELCATADSEINKIRFSGALDISGSMKREMVQALNYIGENLGNKELSLQMVAEKIGVSKNYFSKIFKESTGVKFVDYITKQRMEQARNLYLNSDLKIYEIAELVGYSDWHYLYNLYKKIYGHSLSKEKEGKK